MLIHVTLMVLWSSLTASRSPTSPHLQVYCWLYIYIFIIHCFKIYQFLHPYSHVAASEAYHSVILSPTWRIIPCTLGPWQKKTWVPATSRISSKTRELKWKTILLLVVSVVYIYIMLYIPLSSKKFLTSPPCQGPLPVNHRFPSSPSSFP